MKKLLIAALAFAALLAMNAPSAAQTAPQAVMGYMTTVGCPGGQPSCFVQYGTPLPVSQGALPTGAATAALQSNVQGTVAAGTAATNSELSGCVYNSIPPALTNGQQVATQCDIQGDAMVRPADAVNFNNTTLSNGTVTNGLFSSGTVTNPGSSQVILGPIDTAGAQSFSFDQTYTSGTGPNIQIQQSSSASGPWQPAQYQSSFGAAGLVTQTSSNTSFGISGAVKQRYIQVVVVNSVTAVISVQGYLRSSPFVATLTLPQVNASANAVQAVTSAGTQPLQESLQGALFTQPADAVNFNNTNSSLTGGGTVSGGLFTSGTVTNPSANQVIIGPIDTYGAQSFAFEQFLTSGTAGTITIQESATGAANTWTTVYIQISGGGSPTNNFGGNNATAAGPVHQRYIQLITNSVTGVFTVSGYLRSSPFIPVASQQQVILLPNGGSTIGITPIVSASAENNHVLKNSGGNLYSVYATNLTSTAGFLVLLNATSAPGDGAITPLECVPLPASGNASINYSPGPPSVFSTGITAVLTSASTCFTKTTGVITGFIKGSVQ